MTASDVVVGAAAPAVKVRLASFALNGHVRLGLGAVIYLVEAEGRFVRIANIGTNRSEWWLFTLILFTCLISFTIHDFKNDTEQVPLALQIVAFLQTLPAS